MKYQRAYLKTYDSVSAAREDIADYFNWYNTARSHSSLKRILPQQAYLSLRPKIAEAA